MPLAALLVLALLVGSPGTAAPRDAAGLCDELVRRNVPARAVTTDGAGGVFVFLGGPSGYEALAWVGRLPNGHLVSSRTTLDLGPASLARAEPTFRRLFEALGDPALEAGELLAVSAAGRADAAGRLDALRVALAAPVPPPEGGAGWSSPQLVTWLALLEVLALLSLVLVQATRGARTRPREALALAGLVGLALLVRALTSSRLPVGAANADFTHLLHATTWLTDGFGQDLGAAYPPAYRVLLAALFRVFGPDLELAFWTTTVAGALVVVPAALLARRVAGTKGALFAGLALATYPPAVVFSNGVDLSMPAALLLTLSFERLLAARERPEGLTLAAWALATLLFVQCRVEAVGLALPLLLAQGALLVEQPPRGAPWRLGLAAVLALALGAPYLGSLTAHASDLGKAADALPLLLQGSAALCATAVGWFVAARQMERRASLPIAWLIGLTVATLTLLVAVALRRSGHALVPAPQVVPEFPFTVYHVEQGPLRFVDHAGLRFPWTEPGVFPWLTLIPWALSLLPAPAGSGRRLPLAAPLLLALPIVAWVATSRSLTGIAGFEGLRLHAVSAGLVAASIGLGAERVLAWVGPGGSRRIAAAMLVAVLLASLVTHENLLHDREHSPQIEARLARQALARLPDAATLLLVDDAVDMREESLGVRSVLEVFRGDHLWRALAALEGRRLRVVPLSAFRELPLPLDGPVFAWLGLDCARARHPETALASCRDLRRGLASPPLLEAEAPNRAYESLGLPWFSPATSTLRFSLLPVSPSEAAMLRHPPASRLVNPASERL